MRRARLVSNFERLSVYLGWRTRQIDPRASKNAMLEYVCRGAIKGDGLSGGVRCLLYGPIHLLSHSRHAGDADDRQQGNISPGKPGSPGGFPGRIVTADRKYPADL